MSAILCKPRRDPTRRGHLDQSDFLRRLPSPNEILDRVWRAMAQRPLTVLAFDGDDDNQLSKDTLKLVNNQVNQSTGTVTLKAKFANRNAALCLG